MIQIKKIPLKELQKFVDSTLFLSLKNKPISNLRATSYINNPNANSEDINLYLAFINEQLVGYRTLFTGRFIYNNKAQKFCWLSGSWTHENHRRKGISSKLFNEIYNDWNGKIIFANYAPTSKALYDKTKVFTKLKTLNGTRYYRRICLAEVLKNKNTFFKKIKPILSITDWISNLFLDLRFSKNNDNQNFNIEKVTNWNEKTVSFLNTFKTEELFQRNFKTYQWIKQYPWMDSTLETKKKNENYHFSTFAKVFESDFYKITNKNTGNIVALVNISIRNKQLKIPYLYALPENMNVVKQLVLELCKEYKISFMTIFHDNLNTILKKGENQFLKQKSFEQGFFISNTLLAEFELIKNFKIQTGDGDGIFT